MAMANVNVIGAQPVHLRMYCLDQVITRLLQNLQLLLRHCVFEDEVSLLAKLRLLFLSDNRHVTSGGSQTANRWRKPLDPLDFRNFGGFCKYKVQKSSSLTN